MSEAARAYLVEVAGVAGAGKSTLTGLLSGAGAGYRVGEFIHARTPEHLAYVARSVPRLRPILARNLVMTPRMSWADVKLLVYVSEWHRLLSGDRAHRDGVTLLDQGPLYALVRLRAQRTGVTRSSSFERWWNAELERWAAELAAVVFLDATDRVLLARIDGRAQPHRTKRAAPGAGAEFLDRYRRLFEEVLGRIDVPGGPKVLRFDTTATAADRIAVDLLPMLEKASTNVPAGSQEDP